MKSVLATMALASRLIPFSKAAVLLIGALGLLVPAAASAITLTIQSPADGQVLDLNDAGPAPVQVQFTFDGGSLGPGAWQIRWYLDSAAQGFHNSSMPYTFVAVPKGLHRLTGVPVEPGGLERLSDAASVYVRLSIPCATNAECDDGNPCSKERCRASAGGSRCAYASTVEAGCCFTQLECGGGGFCQANACVQCSADAHCEDGNPCTINTCVAGQCLRSVTPGCCTKNSQCNDGNACTLDVCNPGTNTCSNTPQGTCCSKNSDCNDGNDCTIDRCNGGICESVPHPLKPNCCQTAANCNDGNSCTTDSCVANTCQHAPVANCCASAADCADDGNPCTTTVCNGGSCGHIAGPCTYALPYGQPFSAGTLAAADFTTQAAGVGAAAWSVTPQLTSRLQLPTPVPATDTEHWMITPVLDASTASAPITLQWRQGFVGNTSLADFSLDVVVSLDAGATWQPTPLYVQGSIPATQTYATELAFASAGRMVNVDAPQLIGQAEVKLAFRCTGKCGGGLAWLVDDVAVGTGKAPVLMAVPNTIVEENSTKLLPLLATDIDSAPASLQFSIVDSPSFAFAVTTGGGSGLGILQPILGDLGTYPLTVRVTDGFFQDRQPFTAVVAPASSGTGGGPGSGTGVRFVVIRDEAGGAGSAVGDLSLPAGTNRTFYAAGYDANLNYISDVNVLWSTTGTLPLIPEGPSPSVAVTFSQPFKLGKVRATHPNPDIAGDDTGTITITSPGPQPLDPAQSALSASKAALVANGTDTLTLTVALKDALGNPFTTAAAVVINSTAGTLLGSVINNGDGTYTQVLRSSAAPTTATVTATANGDEVGNSLTIPFVTVLEITTATTISCANIGTYQNQNIVVRNATLTINSAQCAPMRFGHVTLEQNGIVTHAAATASVVETIDIEVQSLFIDTTSRIDVNGRGLLGGRSVGNATTYIGGSRTGGSHGGRGGVSSASTSPGIVYDSLWSPSMPGAGAVTGTAPGGGVVRIRTLSPTGGVAVHGSIQANGNTANDGGGAGGTVFIDSRALSGPGSIQARGGDGSTSSSFFSGGGGGGRVAVVNAELLSGNFAPSQWVNGFDARGGGGFGRGGAGTVFVRRTTDSFGNLFLDNKGVVDGITPMIEAGQGDWEAITGATALDSDLPARPGNYYAGIYINPNVTQNTSAAVSDDTLVRVTGSSGAQLSFDTNLTGLAAVGQAYRTVYIFDNLEIRGRGNLHSTADIWVLEGDLTSFDNITFAANGSVTANALDLESVQSISITNGQIAALFTVGQFSATHPFEYTLTNATLNTSGLYAHNVFAQGSTITVGQAFINDVLTLIGTTMTVTEDQLHATLVNLQSSSVLRHGETSPDKVQRLVVQAVGMSIDASSQINVSARGYTPGRAFGNSTTFGAQLRSGGSNGGRGGMSSAASPEGVPHGDLYRPLEPGGGAGTTSTARGGGVVHLNIAAGLVVDGQIIADGQGANDSGGAGGSVLIEAQGVGGTGSIFARGGAGSTSSSFFSGGGGGGRVAIYAQSTSGNFAANVVRNAVDLRGGGGFTAGGAGTLYYKIPGLQYGNLIVDNKGVNAPERSTPLPSVGSAPSDSVISTGLVDVDAGWWPGFQVGSKVNPNVEQGNPDSLLDDLFFSVVGQTLNSLTLSGNPTGVAATGDTYRAIHAFDNLQVSGLGRVYMDGDLLVLRGDIDSADNQTLALSGSVECTTLDINGVTQFNVNSGALKPGRLLGGGAFLPLIAYNLTGVTAVFDGLFQASSVTVVGGSFSAGALGVAQSMTVRGGATVTITNDTMSVGGTLSIIESSVLTHASSTSTQVRRLNVSAASLVIEAGSRIDADGRGYLPGRGWQNETGFASAGRSGGSHGGRGGLDSVPSLVGAVMGNLIAPTEPGGGAGTSSAAVGGGVIRVQVTNAITLNGTIQANGGGNNNGGAAGGSVWIQCASIGGTGSIQARGGAGSTSSSFFSGGGGGGRVAVYYDVLAGGYEAANLHARFDVRGGTGHNAGGAGTVFLKGASQAWGDLIVDNKGVSSPAWSTPLLNLSAGVASVVGTDGFVNNTALSPDNFLSGALVRFGGALSPALPTGPVGPGGTTTWDLPTVFRVGEHTSTVFSVNGDPSAVASNGAIVSPIFIFDNVEIRGLGQADFPGDLLVWGGDISSGNTTNWVMDGSLRAQTLQLRNVSAFTASNGNYNVQAVHGAGVVNPQIAYVWNNLVASLPALNTLTVSALGGTINAGTITTAGGFSLDGAAVAEVSAEDLVVGGDLTLGGTSQLRHAATDAGVVRRLTISAANVTVGPSASIDATGRGYLPGRGWNNLVANGANTRSGGSHGGLGGRDNLGSSPGIVYGSLYQPTEPGGGAGPQNSSASGGGVIKLVCAGTVQLQGAIRANGLSNNWGGSAGGSIWIQTSMLSGTGSIEAVGGSGSSSSSFNSAGGSGGRIAIYYSSLAGSFATATIRSRLFMQGGSGLSAGGSGTAYLRGPGQQWGDLIVDNRGQNAVEGSTPLLAVAQGTATAVAPTGITTSGSPWLANYFVGTQVNLNSSKGAANSLLDDPIYTITNNTTNQLGFSASPVGEIAVGGTFRAAYAFDNLQINGNARLSLAGDLLVVRGDLESNNLTTLAMQGSLDVTRLDVNQVNAITMNTGTLKYDIIQGGGAQNPPIAHTYTNATVLAPNFGAASLVITGGSLTTSTIQITGAMQLAGAALVSVSNKTVNVAGGLTLADTSVLTHEPCTASEARSLEVTANNVIILPGASIDVSGRGYLPGRAFGNALAYGPSTRSGGSHGGLGGQDNLGSTAGIVYGSLYEPVEPGAGAGPQNSSAAGGGAVKIAATTSILINGTIRANGQSNSWAGAAGGSIWLQASSVAGTGSIEAVGGTGSSSASFNSGAGGGGRVAIHYATSLSDNFALLSIASAVNIRGGNAGLNLGGSGTLFVKRTVDPWGDLFVDNRGIAAPQWSTPLPSVGTGSVDALTANSLTSGSIAWLAGYHRDYFVNPNVAQGNPHSLTDDAIFRVTNNTISTLTLAGNPTAAASVGSVFRQIYVFRNLQVSGNARLFTTGDILVLNGDVASNNNSTFSYSGAIAAHTLDLNLVTLLTGQTGALQVTKLQAHGQEDYRFDIELNGAGINKPLLRAKSFAGSNATLDVGTLDVQTNALFSGGTSTLRSLVAGGDVVLSDNSTLTQPFCTSTQEVGLDIHANRLIINTGSKIDVSGRGYTPGYGIGLSTELGAKNRSGGSHGGRGGQDNLGAAAGAIFDSYRWPHHPGGGAGPANSSAAGGGAVRITASTGVVVDGQILADGASNSWAGAAGGTIRIVAPAMGGTGSLWARGGNGNSSASFNSGAGGGGRVAIHAALNPGSAFAPISLASAVDVRGGNGGLQLGGAGTIYYEQPTDDFGSLIIDNKGVLSPAGSTPLFTAGLGESQAITETTLSDPSAGWAEATKVLEGTYISPKANQGLANSLEDDEIFRIDSVAGGMIEIEEGDLTTVAQAGDAYRGLHVFENFEVRGNARVAINGDVLVYSGDVTSNDSATFNVIGDLGAEYLDLSMASTVGVSNGTFQVDKIFRDGSATFPFSWSANSATINLSRLDAASLATNSSNLNVGIATVLNNFFQSGGTVTISNGLLSVGDVYAMTSNAVLTHPTSTTTAIYSLKVEATTLNMEAGSRIDVAGKGYTAGRGHLNDSVVGSTGRHGGSHAGVGGPGNIAGVAGIVYGNFMIPRLPGGGGTGGSGGGAVELEITGGLILNGLIDVRGANGNPGGGAGGSVLIDASNISGTGTIEARGGSGNTSNGGGGGAGGRIALRGFNSATGNFAPAVVRNNARVAGGVGVSSSTGGAGTVFLRSASQTYGDLIIDGTGTTPPVDSTPLLSFGVGNSTALTASQLTDSTKVWRPGLYAGMWLNPNVTQGGTATRTDDALFALTTNGLTTLSIGIGNLTTVASAGNSYRPILPLNRLELRSARVTFDGDILVYDGDLHSAANTFFDVPAGATLTARVIELVNALQANITGSVTATESLLCSNCP